MFGTFECSDHQPVLPGISPVLSASKTHICCGELLLAYTASLRSKATEVLLQRILLLQHAGNTGPQPQHQQRCQEDGLRVPIIKCQRSKRTKQWVAYKEIAAKDFSIAGMNFWQPLSFLTLLHTACTETMQKLFQSVSFHVTNTSVVYIKYVSVADSSWQPAEAKLNTGAASGHRVNGSIYTIKNNSNSNMNKQKKFI